MTARQIGRLAEHTEAALRAHPEVPRKVKESLQEQPWEVALAKAVDADPDLPSYESLCSDYILDELVAYLGSKEAL